MLRSAILLRYKLCYAVDDNVKPGLLILINLAKKMEEVLDRRDVQLMHDLIVKFMGLNLARILKSHYGRVKASKIANKDFLLSAFKLGFSTFNHYPTTERKMVTSLCTDFLRSKGALKDNEFTQFKELLWEFNLLLNYKEYYKQALSCSFSYWIRDMMADFLSTMGSSEGEYFRLQLFLNSLEDSKDLLLESRHLDSPNELIDEYRGRVIEYLDKNFLSHVVNALSDDLLHQSHHFYMVYELDKPSPFK